MASLQWSPNLVLGVAAMDAEHQQLITAMQRIEELDARKAPKTDLDAAILRLAALTKEHFAHEERHMRSIGFADLDRHARIHADMLAKIDQHYAAFAAGPGAVPPDFLNFLSFWLSSHIQGIDRKYVQAKSPAPAPARR